MQPEATGRWAASRRYQLRLVAEGRCRVCGKPRGEGASKNHCNGCRLKHNEYARRSYQKRKLANA